VSVGVECRSGGTIKLAARGVVFVSPKNAHLRGDALALAARKDATPVTDRLERDGAARAVDVGDVGAFAERAQLVGERRDHTKARSLAPAIVRVLRIDDGDVQVASRVRGARDARAEDPSDSHLLQRRERRRRPSRECLEVHGARL
jgi:hypothetical protein